MIQQVGKYVLKSELGKGAMGSVWLSEHPGLAIPVAVKILDPELAAEDPDYRDRFIKEGKLAASINHQNVVRIIDAGNDGPIHYLVMELIDGADAKQLVEHRGALPVEEVLELAICTAEALKEAHSKGIVHRDIKPDNILVTSDGKVKVADLGIAKQINDDYGTTMAGTTIGTPYYIAPEQAMDSSTVDRRCDIYALGGTLYHLLTGTLPFTGPSAMAILMKHTQEELQHPKERKPDLPDSICQVVCNMMEKHPDDRYQDCSELLKDLKAIKNKKSTSLSKKKKHIKAPSKKKLTMTNMDKELGDMKPVSQSVKKVLSRKKKKTSKTPLIVGVIVLLLIISGIFIFKPKTQDSRALQSETAKKEETKTQVDTKDTKSELSTKPKDDVKSPNKSSNLIKIINQPHPYILDLERSKTLKWHDNWSVFVEFKGSRGTLVGKTIPNKWAQGSRALYVNNDGRLVYDISKIGNINTSVKVNDGKYHTALLTCKNGKVTFYIDGKLQGSKSLSFEDRKDFNFNVGASNSKYNFKGHIRRVAFWKVAPTTSRLKHFLIGRFDRNRVPFYYENKLKDAEKPVEDKNITQKIIEGLKRDNPGVSISSNRVSLKENDLYIELNDTKIKNIASLKGYPIKRLNLSKTKVEDFSPLKEMPIVELDLSMIRKPISLKHLNYKTLRWLRLMHCDLLDLNEFKKFNIYYLAIKQHPYITGYLKHMELYRLDMDNAAEQVIFENLNKNTLKELRICMAKGVKDISKLKDFKLKAFHLTESPCEDLSVLKGMPLEDVALMGTSAQDLSFLKNAPVKNLILNYRCETIGIIKTLKNLQRIAIPGRLWGPEIEFLRNTKVEIEGYRNKKEHWWLSWGLFQRLDSKKFWKDYDKYKRSK